MNSNIPIIEISVKNFDDLEWLTTLSSFESTPQTMGKISFYNFSSSKFVVYKINNNYEFAFYLDIPFLHKDYHDDSAVFEINFEKQVHKK